MLVRQGLSWTPLFPGSQERGRRGGTENLPGILGAGAAAERMTMSPEAWQQHIDAQTRLRDQLEQGLRESLPGTVIFGEHTARLPNTSYLRFGQVHADVVLQRLERLGVMASSGAACSSSGQEPSPVLLAMGVSRADALCAIRLSLSAQTTTTQIQTVLERLPLELAPSWLNAPRRAARPHPQLECSHEDHDPQGQRRRVVGVRAQEGSGRAHRVDGKAGHVGGLVTLANGWQMALPEMPEGTTLPITVEARRTTTGEEV